MTDVKYPPVSLNSDILGESEVSQIDFRMEMHKKLELNEDQTDFLNVSTGAKFMTRFEIGKDKIVMYGNPVRMALNSELIKSLLSIDPPYFLAANMTIYGGALTLLWLYINGVSITEDQVDKLSFKGWLNLYEIIRYLGIVKQSSKHDIIRIWRREFDDKFNHTDSKTLNENAKQIASLFDKLIIAGELKNLSVSDTEPIMRLVTGYKNIIDEINYIPVFIVRVSCHPDRDLPEEGFELLDWIPRGSDEFSELIKCKQLFKYLPSTNTFVTKFGHKILTPTRQPHGIFLYDKDLSYYPQTRDRFKQAISLYEMKPRTNVIV